MTEKFWELSLKLALASYAGSIIATLLMILWQDGGRLDAAVYWLCASSLWLVISADRRLAAHVRSGGVIYY
jgi:hypothetical protein